MIYLDTHWDHKHIHRLANKKQHNNFKIENNHLTLTIANAFSKQVTNTVKHKTHNTNGRIDRKTPKLQTTTITLLTTPA